MKLFILILFSVCIYQASAYRILDWLTNDGDDEDVDQVPTGTLTAMAEITNECLQQGGWGQCSFYDCLENRFPCSDDGYTNKISKHFCTKIDQNYHLFDEFGRLWLNQTSICLIRHMLPIYQQEEATCEEIKQAGITAILSCNNAQVDGRTFCSFLSTNGGAYNSLMETEELRLMASLGEPRVFASMVSQALGCGVSGLADTLRNLGYTVSEFAGNVFSSVRGWFS
ncbi:hypothetical protein ACF0H5_010044 [Mactra antiquata]